MVIWRLLGTGAFIWSFNGENTDRRKRYDMQQKFPAEIKPKTLQSSGQPTTC